VNLFNELTLKHRPLIGTIVSLSAPPAVEAISRCGFDWLWIDMEHAPLTLEHVQHILMAKSAECAGFVRIPVNDETWIKRVLDLGADGIIVPQVKTKEEAQRAVAAGKYPPMGTRSAGLARAQGYGMSFASYIKEANQNTSVLLQIEHADGVKNVEEILEVEGIDAIIIGPYDLSGSYGKLGEVQDKQVTDAIDVVYKACKQRGIPIGIFAMQPEAGKAYLEKGFQLLAVGADIHYMWTAAKAGLEAVSKFTLAESKK
jgi:2-dehydro-3-deoxyglucarate aldolase/4-hydroxy-2-oxoheptanedioate aldolase